MGMSLYGINGQRSLSLYPNVFLPESTRVFCSSFDLCIDQDGTTKIDYEFTVVKNNFHYYRCIIYMNYFLNLQELLTTEVTDLLFGAVTPHTEIFALSTIYTPQ